MRICITRNCQLECEHCFRGGRQDINMSPRTIKNLFKNIASVKHLVITGGEPFLAVDALQELADIIIKKNIRIHELSIITNMVTLSPKILNIMKKLSRSSCIENLYILVSDDVFHELELERLGLKEQRDKNINKFKGENITCVFDPVYFNSSEFPYPILPIMKRGRACKIPEERLKEIGYRIGKIIELTPVDESQWLQPEIRDNSVVGDVNIDVFGNLVGTAKTYEEQDESTKLNPTNINRLSLADAINLFSSSSQSHNVTFGKGHHVVKVKSPSSYMKVFIGGVRKLFVPKIKAKRRN